MSFLNTVKYCLEQELDAPCNDDDSNLNNPHDPFDYLGYGVNAYFDFLISLSNLFWMMTIFSIPLYLIYSSGEYF